MKTQVPAAPEELPLPPKPVTPRLSPAETGTMGYPVLVWLATTVWVLNMVLAAVPVPCMLAAVPVPTEG